MATKGGIQETIMGGGAQGTTQPLNSNLYSKATIDFGTYLNSVMSTASKLSTVTLDMNSANAVLQRACQQASTELSQCKEAEAKEPFVTNVINNLADVVNNAIGMHDKFPCSCCSISKINCRPIPFEDKKKSSLLQICTECFQKLCINFLNGCIDIGSTQKIALKSGKMECKDFYLFVEAFYPIEYQDAENELKKKLKKQKFNKDFALVPKGKYSEKVGAIAFVIEGGE
jgi:hypothetical protein